jgi:hypothetical protein
VASDDPGSDPHLAMSSMDGSNGVVRRALLLRAFLGGVKAQQVPHGDNADELAAFFYQYMTDPLFHHLLSHFCYRRVGIAPNQGPVGYVRGRGAIRIQTLSYGARDVTFGHYADVWLLAEYEQPHIRLGHELGHPP